MRVSAIAGCRISFSGIIGVTASVARSYSAPITAYCAGCCASLMIVLMVVGLMNMVWMVGLSVLIYLEKIVPRGSMVVRAAGVALCAAGVQRIVA